MWWGIAGLVAYLTIWTLVNIWVDRLQHNRELRRRNLHRSALTGKEAKIEQYPLDLWQDPAWKRLREIRERNQSKKGE